MSIFENTTSTCKCRSITSFTQPIGKRLVVESALNGQKDFAKVAECRTWPSIHTLVAGLYWHVFTWMETGVITRKGISLLIARDATYCMIADNMFIVAGMAGKCAIRQERCLKLTGSGPNLSSAHVASAQFLFSKIHKGSSKLCCSSMRQNNTEGAEQQMSI